VELQATMGQDWVLSIQSTGSIGRVSNHCVASIYINRPWTAPSRRWAPTAAAHKMQHNYQWSCNRVMTALSESVDVYPAWLELLLYTTIVWHNTDNIASY